MNKIIMAAALCAVAVSTEALMNTGELGTVNRVDLARYLGTWYEVAKYPVVFEKGLTAVTATYSLRPDGGIKVLNAGRKGSRRGN